MLYNSLIGPTPHPFWTLARHSLRDTLLGVEPHHTNFIMNAIRFLKRPVVLALFVLAACVYILDSTATRFYTRAQIDRDDMVASLRQAQTPEPQIAAISKAFDGIISEAGSMATSFFAFTSVILVCAFAARRGEPSRKDFQKQPDGELKHEPVV
jgi:hypothetical protein